MTNSVTIGGLKISHSGTGPYVARSASDRDPDWPIWHVADAVGFNGISVAGRLTKLFQKEDAILIADKLNQDKTNEQV